MKKVALVTYNKQPKLFDSDNLLVKPFQKHGFIAEATPWDRKGVDWKEYDLVILRTPWNYHLQVPEFLGWIEYLESQKVKLWNPPNIIRWNMNKKYLLELSNMGIPIIPTLICSKENIHQIPPQIMERNWKEIILKPGFGASSYQIQKIKAEDFDPESKSIQTILKNSILLIQQFMKEISTTGEFSFIFFDKKFSHAIHKKPKVNEFRSQPEFGGIEILYQPTSQQISQAQHVLNHVDSPLLYARVDGLIIKDKFRLMELELIEPDLYFVKEKRATEKFVKSAIELSNKYQPD